MVRAQQDDTEDDVAKVAIGQRFRKAREGKNYSVADVAKELRLPKDIITAIEADDFHSLPSTTYLFGYVRNYARLLGISPDDAVNAYQEIEFDQPQYIADALRKTQRPVMTENQAKKSSFSIWPIVLLLVVVMVVSVYVFFSDLKQIVSPEVFETNEPEQEVLSLPDEVDAPTEVINKPVVNKAEAQPLVQSENVVEASVPSVKEAEQVKEAKTDGQLRLVFKEDCWVEIRDVSRKVLLVDLVKAGDSRTLQSDSAIKVFLGNAPGVQVFYNGALFDHSPYVKGKLARFELG